MFAQKKDKKIYQDVARQDRRVYDNRDNRSPYPDGASRDAQIEKINREYDSRISSIRNHPHLSFEEKERRIRQLEAQRERRIRNIYNDNRGYDDDDDYKKNKKYKQNNGKHLGWEKGKGNPHKRR